MSSSQAKSLKLVAEPQSESSRRPEATVVPVPLLNRAAGEGGVSSETPLVQPAEEEIEFVRSILMNALASPRAAGCLRM